MELQLAAATIVQGLRHQTFGYDPTTGYLSSVTDALTQMTLFERDLVGRTTRQTLPDESVIAFSYDPGGNMSSLAPPGKPTHGFDYTPVDLMSSYDPPAVTDSGTTSTAYSYNLDRQLKAEQRPDGLSIQRTYDAAGTLETLVLPTGTATYGYYPATGALASITGPYDESLAFSYDGSLTRQVLFSGPVLGSVEWQYNSDFRVTTETTNDAAAVSYAYDNDGLVTGAGALTRTLEPQSGRVLGTALGSVTDTFGYNEYGERISYDAGMLAISYTRDLLGRIATKTEIVDGEARIYEYTYDLRGRLTDVHIDGVPSEHYDYDANGNRTNGTYDDQDRLLAYGTKSYTWSANGELESVHDSATGETTGYEYDVQGALRRVDLAGGDVIEYVIDGQGRRVGKKVNGTFEWGLLYRSQLQPVAEVDAAGNVVGRFVYSGGRNVPEYVESAGQMYRLITDHLGSVRRVVNATTGEVVQRMEYDSFGRVLVDEVTPGWRRVPFGFAGGIYDPDTELVRFGARDYDAEVGRWTSGDPLRFDGGDTNLFAYAGLDPVNWSDPGGRAPQPTKRKRPKGCYWDDSKYQKCMDASKEKEDECLKNCKPGPDAYLGCVEEAAIREGKCRECWGPE